MISTEKNPRATTIAAAEPKDTSPSGDTRHAAASERHPSATAGRPEHHDLCAAAAEAGTGVIGSYPASFGNATACCSCLLSVIDTRSRRRAHTRLIELLHRQMTASTASR